MREDSLRLQAAHLLLHMVNCCGLLHMVNCCESQLLTPTQNRLMLNILTRLLPRGGDVTTLSDRPSNIARTFCFSWVAWRLVSPQNALLGTQETDFSFHWYPRIAMIKHPPSPRLFPPPLEEAAESEDDFRGSTSPSSCLASPPCRGR